jgi:hypothetical protein
MQKRCTKCKQYKDRGQFHRCKSFTDGLTYWCKACASNYKRRYYRSNPDFRKKVLERSRTRLNDPEIRKRVRQTSLDWHRKKSSNCTPEQYNKLLKKQKGVCACCGKPETSKRKEKIRQLSVDHCHKTNKVRWLLCHKCNLGLGHFDDNPKLLMKMATMLKKFAARKKGSK